eukprot:m.40555 g.40555  ORF g.40555 m.40555 type:complete len:254 (-) comp14828_c0_seq1:235-996(-)
MAKVAKQPRKVPDEFDLVESTLQSYSPDEVEAWSVLDVCEKFLVPLGLAKLQQTFVDEKITGHVLLTLDKRDLKELDLGIIGDLVLVDRSLEILRREFKKVQREKVLWYGRWPEGGIAYYENGGQCCVYTLCGCLFSTLDYRFTSMGIKIRTNPPTCNICCRPMFNDNSDYRFLKDIDAYERPTLSCCCIRRGVNLTFDVKDESDERAGLRPKMACGKTVVTGEKMDLSHPGLVKDKQDLIKHHWSEARLVSD